ncbi:MAG TPA: TlpA disulfide reductase family protein [Puia sp.]|jgi:thiol-disulfide isomerase/thioredoxin|nr:TlpA disulfide reductase family protein [Puia sp.]
MNRICFTLFLMVISLNLFSQMRPGQSVVDLSLPDLNGKMVSLSELKGKVVLIDFWASWCGPCRHNNPHLVKLYNKYHSKGLEIFGISLDEDIDDWKKAVRHDKLIWIQVIDDKGWQAPSAYAFGVDMIPTSFLIDRQGVIRTINAEGADLESNIRDLLKD